MDRKYRPPHERQRDNQNNIGGSTGFRSYDDRDNSAQAREERFNALLNSNERIPQRPYRSPNQNPNQNHNQNRYRNENGLSNLNRPINENSTYQSGPSNYQSSPFNQSCQSVKPSHNVNKNGNELRKSKKDWSSPMKPVQNVQSILASPSEDIKPMRKDLSRFGTPKPEDEDFDFELIQSVSRSGGDGAEGDALKDWEIQNKYRAFIEKKVDKHYRTFKTARHKLPLKDAKDEVESLGSLVLLFRKLREGVVASSRIDEFAIEVFESSAQFSILANNKPQLISSLSGLVPGLYRAVGNCKVKGISNVEQSESLDEGSISDGIKVLSIKKDTREEFISLFFLYQLINLGEKDFWSSYFELTNPTRKSLRQPFKETDHAYQTNGPRQQVEPFISPSELQWVISIARSISVDHFNPIKYFKLYNGATEYEKSILSWGEHKIRERAWEIMRKAYLSTGQEWAKRFLGVNQEHLAKWIEEKGFKVESGLIKLR
ncbi:uncharacterized protein L201_002956 [Kwoniella dendrophila CBS 6074]|uniref:Uncharacterized protein n=1 Tax=Kwoniella dendrophila CBS 6074 TaxID=1295534 RepID=A0AAX4JT40_9TREE